MLIVAQPKSASTSLKHAIAENSFTRPADKCHPGMYEVLCDECPEMQKIFTTIYELDSYKVYNMITDHEKVYKKHIIPNSRHLKIIDKIKKPIILLLRDVNDSIKNLELHKKYHRPIFSWDYDIEKLKNEYRYYKESWESFSKNKDYILKIYYKDLVLDYENTIDRIFIHLGLRRRVLYSEFPKINYTGNGIKKYVNS